MVIAPATLHRLLTYATAAVWLINGLFCKVLNLVPRHKQIVARILGDQYAPVLTVTIGVSEMLMALWILSRIRSRLCALAQIGLVAVMNSIEFVLAPDLLLFGRLNALNAVLFMGHRLLQRICVRSLCYSTEPMMLSFLKNHPFAVEAFFDFSLVLTYAVPKSDLQPLIPPCLELDTFNDDWAFVAVALVQTKALRPKGMSFLPGNDFFLIGYRIFVRYTTNAGKRLRGLYILKSETDSKLMELLGDIFTKYAYRTIDINRRMSGTVMTVTSQKAGFAIEVETNPQPVQLPPSSVFTDWKEARRYTGPLPFTFSYAPETRQVLLVEGVREHWQPTPVQVLRADLFFFNTLGLADVRLANAFIIHDIPYHWKRGRTELWNG